MHGHTYSKGLDQPGKVANPARGQLNGENNGYSTAFSCFLHGTLFFYVHIFFPHTHYYWYVVSNHQNLLRISLKGTFVKTLLAMTFKKKNTKASINLLIHPDRSKNCQNA